jgi:hypothetical protein
MEGFLMKAFALPCFILTVWLGFGFPLAAQNVFPPNGSVGVGTSTPSAALTVVVPGGPELSGTAMSSTILSSAGRLGTDINDELPLASFGFFGNGNNVSLGIRGVRSAEGPFWQRTAIGLGMDVDDTVRAGANIWLNSSGNVGIGTEKPHARLSVVAPGGPELTGSAKSSTFLTSAGNLGTSASDRRALASFGIFDNGNSTSLGIRAVRLAAGRGWTTSALQLGMDVDDTENAGAMFWMHPNGNVAIGPTFSSAAQLSVWNRNPGQDLIQGFDNTRLVFRVDSLGNVYANGIQIGAAGAKGDKGDKGDRGPAGPPGPATKTVAVCGPASWAGPQCGCTNEVAKTVALPNTSCAVSAESGSCEFLAGANNQGQCCVCAP